TSSGRSRTSGQVQDLIFDTLIRRLEKVFSGGENDMTNANLAVKSSHPRTVGPPTGMTAWWRVRRHEDGGRLYSGVEVWVTFQCLSLSLTPIISIGEFPLPAMYSTLASNPSFGSAVEHRLFYRPFRPVLHYWSDSYHEPTPLKFSKLVPLTSNRSVL
ncbi:hypothetical protein B296_00046588, partial [Ensete ventricosum]